MHYKLPVLGLGPMGIVVRNHKIKKYSGFQSNVDCTDYSNIKYCNFLQFFIFIVDAESACNYMANEIHAPSFLLSLCLIHIAFST